MALPRTFVGFSSNDIHYYRLMQGWKAHEHIDFDFCDCQLQSAIRSTDEYYIKTICRGRISMAGTYILLIGEDTRYKHKYVLWETEVAIEKKCRIIGVNLDGWRRMNPDTCPRVIMDIGATFVPFSPQIVAHALEYAERKSSDHWFFSDEDYSHLGYQIVGDRAVRPVKPNPYA